MAQRRSLRLQGLLPSSDSSSDKGKLENATTKITSTTRKRKISTSTKKKSKSKASSDEALSLPRTREWELLERKTKDSNNIERVLGVDEAGRGPLAGPVVAAAVWLPPHHATVPGIVDSKRITKEEQRQDLFQRLQESDVVWAAAVMDAPYIDQVNILQATLHGMTLAAQAVICLEQDDGTTPPPPMDHIETKIAYHDKASSSHEGCYVVTNRPFSGHSTASIVSESNVVHNQYYALIDGNRLPKQGMPCPAESMTKGDGREYCIAAASIVAKVVRDNLMREYHEMYPEYNLEQHKGYPTAAHMDLVTRIGASPIYRRSFKPLKDLEFDETGKVLGPKKSSPDSKKKKKRKTSK